MTDAAPPAPADGWLTPDWPAPRGVRACFTTRTGGVSAAPWDALNLAAHVGDDAGAVARNRDIVSTALHLPREPAWLEQVHGRTVLRLDGTGTGGRADASITTGPGIVCAVLVADCLPVLLCDRAGSEVAAVHAGWRGLHAGVVDAAVRAFSAPPGELLAWLGPAIGRDAYPVGPELRERFVGDDLRTAASFVRRGERWHFDLAGAARSRLQRLGVTDVHGVPTCVHADAERFYSYRRDGVTGRMAALVWRA